MAAHGLDAPPFVGLLFANPISRFFASGVIVSALVLIAFMAIEGRNVRCRWRAVAAIFMIGVSCGPPLFLALRARAR